MEGLNIDQYKALLTEVIAKQSVILGPDIAILKARNVAELTISDNGTVTDIQDSPKDALQKLVDEYVALSGQIVRSALSTVFEKYPQLEMPT